MKKSDSVTKKTFYIIVLNLQLINEELKRTSLETSIWVMNKKTVRGIRFYSERVPINTKSHYRRKIRLLDKGGIWQDESFSTP